jgi:hypothetical protein
MPTNLCDVEYCETLSLVLESLLSPSIQTSPSQHPLSGSCFRHLIQPPSTPGLSRNLKSVIISFLSFRLYCCRPKLCQLLFSSTLVVPQHRFPLLGHYQQFQRIASAYFKGLLTIFYLSLCARSAPVRSIGLFHWSISSICW